MRFHLQTVGLIIFLKLLPFGVFFLQISYGALHTCEKDGTLTSNNSIAKEMFKDIDFMRGKLLENSMVWRQDNFVKRE